MKNLWAPWRSKYILSGKKIDKCIFCHAIENIEDKENLVVFRGKLCFCMLNKYPYSGGHLMVLPNKHKKDILDLEQEEMVELLTIAGKAQLFLKKEMNPDGFNIGANIGKVAGAGVEGHFHLHIVPRWLGDTNFMPVLSETKVVSQSMNDIYDVIRLNFDMIK